MFSESGGLLCEVTIPLRRSTRRNERSGQDYAGDVFAGLRLHDRERQPIGRPFTNLVNRNVAAVCRVVQAVAPVSLHED